MGRQSEKDRAKRRHYFKRLAEGNLARFEFEFEKRCSSWLHHINGNAGIISPDSPSVFSAVDEAMEILEFCGPRIFKRYAKDTYDLLTAHCCIALRGTVLPQYYRASRGRICRRAEEGNMD